TGNGVSNPANYLLVNRGANNVFNTTSCVGGVQSDDVAITINSVSYDGGTQTATLNLNGGAQLGKGTYRLVPWCALLSGGAMIQLTDSLTGGFEVGGVDSFRTFTIVLPDLTATKTNNVGGTATLGSNWNWTITVNNGTAAPATFADGQTIL